MRGWTSQGSATVRPASGYPAHAGMDRLTTTRPVTVRLRLPRPCGDGPPQRAKSAPECLVTPPMRGWTCRLPPHRYPIRGYPAHAGMDRHQVPEVLGCAWLPRPCGDGPLPGLCCDWHHWVTPPMRGWTVIDDTFAEATAGYPAHAGMDPGCFSCGRSCSRLPRPCGDGPSERMGIKSIATVTPPMRGWTLQASKLAGKSGEGLPRPCGDGPSELPLLGSCVMVTPPMRGWTLLTINRPATDGGYPAHAGMDHIDGDLAEVWLRLPRPCGDGPYAQSDLDYPPGVTPPMRGWTQSPAAS